jgi:hypothetical protein
VLAHFPTQAGASAASALTPEEAQQDGGASLPPEEVLDEAEREKRQRRCEADITEIANELRDLNKKIDARTGKDGGNAATVQINRCAGYLWKIGKTYERKVMPPDEAIGWIEQMLGELTRAKENDFHSKMYGEDIFDNIIELHTLVLDFLTRNESKGHRAKRLEEQARKQARERAAEEIRAAAEAKRREELEKAQELQRQQKLEEARDLEVQPGWSEARLNILDALMTLSNHMTTRPFKRTEDTVNCCEFLLYCTKYLACDDKYKSPRRKNWSKDDRFKGIYQGNSEFRRNWVALLSQIVRYVEMLYEGEEKGKKLYLNRLQLEKIHGSNYLWDGFGEFWPQYVWSTITQQITTAQAAIDAEPEQPRQSGLWPFHANTKKAEPQGEDVPALLAQLQELGCRD